MALEIYSSAAQLAELHDDWNRLAGNAPMDSWEWASTWWSHFGDGSRLSVLGRRENGQLCGLLPSFLERHRLWGVKLRLLGSGTATTDY
ncbi:MAG: hypothetical protein KDA61_22360 [Planctomycetales bacterium]|nr:hypothetical protein [Planctomycetales bacterium]